MTLRLSIILLWCCSAHAATFYVAPTGNDANPGTLAQPWATFTFASTNVAAGDTVLAQPGIYDEVAKIRGAGTPGSPITFRANGPVTNKWIFYIQAGASNVVIDGFHMNLQTAHITDGAWYIGASIYAFEFAASSNINNISIQNCRIHDTFNPTGSFSGGFYLQSADGRFWPPNAPSSCVFSNNVLSNLYGGVISMAGIGHHVVSNVVTRTHAHDFCAPYGVNHLIEGNVVSHLEAEGGDSDHPDFFQVQGLGGLHIASNIVIRCNQFLDSWNGSVVGFSQEGGDGIRDWTFYNNIWSGIGVLGGMNAPFIKFYNNLFYRCNYMNVGHAIGFGWDPPGPNPNFSRGIGDGDQCYNNIFAVCGGALSTNVGWYAPAGEESEYGTFARTNGSTTASGSWTSQFTTSSCPTNECWSLWFAYTNLSSAVTSIKIWGPPGLMYDISFITNSAYWRTSEYGPYTSYQLPLTEGLYGLSSEDQRFQCRSNLWNCTISTVSFPTGELIVPITKWIVPTQIYANADFNFVCSSNWFPKRAAAPGNPDGFNFWEAHGINGGDPSFTNLPAGDFHLLPTSLLKGKGTPIAAVTTDFDGRPRPNPPTIGPFEAPITGIYYIDYESGSDANNGTDKATPWKRCPGMNGFAGTYTHVAGDQFIFKGGVTWPSAAFQLKITKGGSSDTVRDLYTSDSTWFDGPFWTQPIFDFEDTQIGTGFNSGAGIYLDAGGVPFGFVTFQFLEVKRHRGYIGPPAGNDFGACTFTIGSTVHDITFDHCYIHDWSIPTPAPGQDGGGSGGIAMQPGAGSGCIVTGCTLTQAGAFGGIRCGRALSLFGTVTGCTIYDTPNGFLGSGTIHDCVIHDIVGASDPNAHENAIYCQAPSTVYNNRVYNLNSAASAIYLSPSFSGGTGYDLCYNNLVYNTGAQAPVQVDLEGATPQLTGSRIYNNTLVASGGFCIRAVLRGPATLGLLDMRNNHLITSGGTAMCYNNVPAGCAPVSNFIDLNNLVQTPTVATASGYTQSNAFQPTVNTSPTVGNGVDLSAVFTDSLLGVTRTAGAWDRGAYQFAGAPPPPPAPSRVTIRTTSLRANMLRTK